MVYPVIVFHASKMYSMHLRVTQYTPNPSPAAAGQPRLESVTSVHRDTPSTLLCLQEASQRMRRLRASPPERTLIRQWPPLGRCTTTAFSSSAMSARVSSGRTAPSAYRYSSEAPCVLLESGRPVCRDSPRGGRVAVTKSCDTSVQICMHFT